MPRVTRRAAPSTSLSSSKLSGQVPSRLAYMPADSYTRLAPASAAGRIVPARSAPAWKSGNFESVMPAGRCRTAGHRRCPPVRRLRTGGPARGEPPLMAPVRKSETNGQAPRMAGAPGSIAFTLYQAAETFGPGLGNGACQACRAWWRRPAPRTAASTGMPPWTATRRHSQRFLRKLHGRHHETVGLADKRPGPPRGLTRRP